MTIIYPGPFMVVTLTAIVSSAISIWLTRKMTNMERSKEIKRRIEEHQKKYLEAQKKGDKKELQRLEAEQAEVMGLLKENMYNSMKPMFITTPAILVVLWLFGVWYGKLGAIVSLPFSIPFITKPFKDMGIANGMDWLGLYIIVGILASLSIQIGLKWYDKRREKNEEGSARR